jgi:hypothetical protein
VTVGSNQATPPPPYVRQARWGDWDEVFGRVLEALRELARPPLQRRVPIEVGLDELVERAVMEELHNDRAAECWAVLRQGGYDETAEVARLAASLKAAHETIDNVNLGMQALNGSPDAEPQAAALIRRYLQAQRERASALAAFSASLTNGNSAGEQAPVGAGAAE